MVEGANERRAFVLQSIANAHENGYSFDGQTLQQVANQIRVFSPCKYNTDEIVDELRETLEVLK